MQHNAHRQARLNELLGIANHAFGCFTPGVAVLPLRYSLTSPSVRDSCVSFEHASAP